MKVEPKVPTKRVATLQTICRHGMAVLRNCILPHKPTSALFLWVRGFWSSSRMQIAECRLLQKQQLSAAGCACSISPRLG